MTSEQDVSGLNSPDSPDSPDDPSNPLGIDGIDGIDGIEFIEYATAHPRARCTLLGQMGFVAVGRHSSRDAALAWRHAVDPGAWAIPTRADAMELNSPGMHGVGDSILYFVDRARRFSIDDGDFIALAGLRFFGVVQASAHGALTQLYKGGVSFELVASHLAPEAP